MRARVHGVSLLLLLALGTGCSEGDEARTEETLRDAGGEVREAAEGAADVVEDAAGTAGEALQDAAREVRAEVGGEPDTASAARDSAPR